MATSESDQRAPAPPRVATGAADVNGTALWYEDSGEGPPLVLIHAGIADSRMWDGQVAAFAQRYRVIRYDVRGFGRSPMPPGPYSNVEDLHALLQTLGVERASLVGLSMGGGIALDFALEYPEMVDALVLAASGLGGFQWSDALKQDWAEEDAALEAGDLARAAEINLRMWVDGPARTPDEVDPAVRARVREMLLAASHADDGEQQRLEPPAIARLGEIRVPALVIVGDRDQPDMLAVADRLAGGIAGARKVVVPGVAHMVNMERPEEFSRMVRDFLAARPAGSAWEET